MWRRNFSSGGAACDKMWSRNISSGAAAGAEM
jgi:hypothetical protein